MTDSIASSCSASARFAPIGAGEVQGAAIVDNPLRRLSTIAEASQEEEEAAAVATGSAGGAAADLISLGMAACGRDPGVDEEADRGAACPGAAAREGWLPEARLGSSGGPDPSQPPSAH